MRTAASGCGVSGLSAASANGIIAYNECKVENNYCNKSNDYPFYPGLVEGVLDFSFCVRKL